MIKIIFIILILCQPVYSQSYVFELYNVSKDVISINILKSLSLDDLRLLRNSIYAKHGYKFDSVDLKSIFDTTEENQKSFTGDLQLNDIEQKNIENIFAIEKAADLKILKVWINDIGFTKDIQVINFDGDRDNEIIKLNSENNNYIFSIYALENDHWINIKRISTHNKPNSWTSGDLNNDNIDEVYFCNDDSLFTLEKHKDSLYIRSIQLDEEIWQLLAGDINNDNIDELLVFSFKVKYDYDKPSIPLNLRIYQNSDCRLQLIWKDDKNNFSHSNVSPPFELQFISKYFNDYKNHLFIRSEQSDVSPSSYITYFWENGELIKGSKFYFSCGKLLIDWTAWNEGTPMLIGKLDQLNYQEFYFGGIIYDKNWSYNLFKVNNGKLLDIIKLFSGNQVMNHKLIVLSGKFKDDIESIITIDKNWIKMFK